MVDFTRDLPTTTGAGLFQSQSERPADTRTAQAIQAVGDVVKQGIQGYAINKSNKEFSALSSEFQQEEGSTYTIDEINAVRDTEKRLNLMRQAAAQKGRTAEFRARAETLLKEQINQFPGMAPQFRQSAATILGFDPTGESLQQRMNAINIAATESERELQAVQDTAVNRYKMDPSELYTKEGIAKYDAYTKIENQIYELTQKQRLYDLLNPKVTTDKVSLEERNQAISQGWYNNVDTVRVGSQQRAFGTLNKSLKAMLGEDVNLTNLDWTRLSKLTPEQRNELVYTINEDMVAYRNATGYKDRPAFGSDWDGYAEVAYEPYKNVISALDSEEAFKKFQAEQKLQGAAAVSGIANTPAYKDARALQAIGFDPTSLLESNIGADLLSSLRGTLVPDPSKQDLPKEIPRGITSAQKRLINDQMDSVRDTLKDDPDNKAATLYLNYLEAVAGDKNPSAGQMSDIVKSLNNPSTRDDVKKLLGTDRYVATEVSKSIVKHSNTLALALQKRVSEGLISVTVTDSGIEVSSNLPEDALTEPFRSQNISMAREINRTIVAPFNEAVDSMVFLFGADKQKVIANMLAGTSFIDQIKQEQGNE